MHIDGKTVIVTGGSGGLGEACVRTFVARGANTVIFDVAAEAGTSLARELGDNCQFQRVDVTEPQQVEAAVAAVASQFSAPQILLNCAGGSVNPGAKNKATYSSNGPIDLEYFKGTLALNLVGTMAVASNVAAAAACVAPDENGERGVIINVASAIGFDGIAGMIGYAAAKSAVAGMTLPMARELADYGIRVMCISPGLFDTESFHAPAPNGRWSREQTDQLTANVPHPSRLGVAHEFADLSVAIVENPMLNGETIRLDGALRIPYQTDVKDAVV